MGSLYFELAFWELLQEQSIAALIIKCLTCLVLDLVRVLHEE